MQLFDPKFKKNAFPYIIQSFLGMLVLFFILFFISSITNLTVIASLGASAFTALTMPHSDAARPRKFIGGYIIGIICGVILNYANSRLILTGFHILNHSPLVLTCAVAVGLAMLLMTATNLEHPSAAALAMGMVSAEHVFTTAFVALVGITLICLLKTFLRKWIKNLL